MTDIAFVLDLVLYGLLLITFALIGWKSLELAKPQRFGYPSIARSHLEADDAVELMERWMALLAVIASTAAFVGLAGTVAHIMTALSNIKGSAMDVTVISGPIATSLKATLLGLASAIPAAVAHHLLTRRIEVVDRSMRRYLPESAE